MHGTDFVVEMLPITLGGCDLVLKIQGFATLETIKWNFKNLEMKFHLNRKNYVLRGLKSGKVQMMTQDHLLKAFVNAPVVLKLLLQAYDIVVVSNRWVLVVSTRNSLSTIRIDYSIQSRQNNIGGLNINWENKDN